MPAAVIIHSGDAIATAQRCHRLLPNAGPRVTTTFDDDGEPVVWVKSPQDAWSGPDSRFLRHGQVLIVENDGAWRIEQVPARAAAS
jgi:hypothetical protein